MLLSAAPIDNNRPFRTCATMFSSEAPTINPSRAEWEQNKAAIIRYYIEEELSLKEVIRIMETKHGFVGAT